MLHITNGDSAAHVIRGAGFEGTIIPWKDVLHDGPVPLHKTLSELRPHRVNFVAQRGWATAAEADRSFRRRDEQLLLFGQHEATVLWFEHDLYDQLQLAQLLDWFGRRQLLPSQLLLVQADSFLGEMKPEDVRTVFAERQAVGGTHFLDAQRAWNAFVSSDPKALSVLGSSVLDSLPFMSKAIRRLVQEFPSRGGGLSLTEERILGILVDADATPAELFFQIQSMETDRYLGDASFAWYLGRLSDTDAPLILLEGERVLPRDRILERAAWDVQAHLTADGKRVVAGELSIVEADSGFTRSIGGTTITPSNMWVRSNGTILRPVSA